jgi:hypothetical protein
MLALNLRANTHVTTPFQIILGQIVMSGDYSLLNINNTDINTLRSYLYEIEMRIIENGSHGISSNNEVVSHVRLLLTDKIKEYSSSHIELYKCSPQEILEKETLSSLTRKLEVCLEWVLQSQSNEERDRRFNIVRAQVKLIPYPLRQQLYNTISNNLRNQQREVYYIFSREASLWLMRQMLKEALEGFGPLYYNGIPHQPIINPYAHQR